MKTHEQMEAAVAGPASAHKVISGTSDSEVLRRIVAVFLFAVLTAIAARIAVPIAALPVPLTLQVVAVLLSGYLLGSRLGFSSQIVYLTLGAVGFPVFVAGGGAAYLLGPTGGYLAAFPVAAALAGLGHRRHWRLPARLAMLALAVALIHVMGIAWLQLVTGTTVSFASHVAPFVVGDFLKVAFVLLLGGGLRAPIQRRWLT
ncbi:MAG: biotin transporter BioY [Gemmatimonadota bacterium]